MRSFPALSQESRLHKTRRLTAFLWEGYRQVRIERRSVRRQTFCKLLKGLTLVPEPGES